MPSDTAPTSGQVRRFFRLLQLAHYDATIEEQAGAEYYIDADVAVRLIAGFEDDKRGTPAEAMFRALVSCEAVGGFKLIRPHALELFEYVHRRNRDHSHDEAFRVRASEFMTRRGIDGFLSTLNALRERYAEDPEEKEGVARVVIDVLKDAGDRAFADIEAVRAPWRRRLRGVYNNVLKLDAMGPEMRERQREDFANDDRILQFFQRQSDRRYTSNYRDACALAMLAALVRRRVKRGTGPFVRFYSETAVVRLALSNESDLFPLFDERPASQALALQCQNMASQGIFRDAEYFLMRVRFPEVGIGKRVPSKSLEALMESISRIGVDTVREQDLLAALANFDRQFERGFGGNTLSQAITDFEQLRLIREIWGRSEYTPELFRRLPEWTDVFRFTADATRELLDDQIEDIERDLGSRVRVLKEWFAGYDKIQKSAERRREEGGDKTPQAVRGVPIDDPDRDLGLGRWGVTLSEEESRQVRDLVVHLTESDSAAWPEACRNFASVAQRARANDGAALVACAVLWFLREYRWIEEIVSSLSERLKRDGRLCPASLLVWQGAAWIRGAHELEKEAGERAIALCGARIADIREALVNGTNGDRQLQELGFAYVLFHCWKRTDAFGLERGNRSALMRAGWLEESMSIGIRAKAHLPRRTLAWGLAANHCVYVGMQAHREVGEIMDHMMELAELEAYGIWTARFADTAACYYMWRFEHEASVGQASVEELSQLLGMAEKYLRFASTHSIGDIAVEEHTSRLDRLRVQLRARSNPMAAGTRSQGRGAVGPRAAE